MGWASQPQGVPDFSLELQTHTASTSLTWLLEMHDGLVKLKGDETERLPKPAAPTDGNGVSIYPAAQPQDWEATSTLSVFHSPQLTPLAVPSRCILGASLVAQWLRIHLPMQGTRVRALGREDPTCRKATKPVHRNY